MADTLGSILVEFKGNMSPLIRDLDKAFDRGVSDGRRAGEKTGAAYAEGVLSAVRTLSTGGGVGSIIGDLTGGSLRGSLGMGILGQVAALGVRMSMTASQTAKYRGQLTQLAGDAKQGEAALKSLQQTAADSVFNTEEVVGLGASLSGRLGDVGKGASDTQRVVDAAA